MPAPAEEDDVAVVGIGRRRHVGHLAALLGPDGRMAAAVVDGVGLGLGDLLPRPGGEVDRVARRPRRRPRARRSTPSRWRGSDTVAGQRGSTDPGHVGLVGGVVDRQAVRCTSRSAGRSSRTSRSRRPRPGRSGPGAVACWKRAVLGPLLGRADAAGTFALAPAGGDDLDRAVVDHGRVGVDRPGPAVGTGEDGDRRRRGQPGHHLDVEGRLTAPAHRWPPRPQPPWTPRRRSRSTTGRRRCRWA